MEVRKLSRPQKVAIAIALAAGGWLVTRGDSSSEFVPDDANDTVVDAAIDGPPIDAPIDSHIDAPAATEWTMVTIDGPEADIGLDGADGLDIATIGGNYVLISAFEQSGAIRVITRAGTTSGAWSAVTLSTVVNVEDAKWCDVDSDGHLDVVAGGQGKRIHIWFGPAPWTTNIDIDAATNLQQWLQLDCTTAGGVRLWASGRGTANHVVTVTHGTDTLTKTAHGFSTGDVASWSCAATSTGGTCTTPAGLALNTVYYVIRTDANNFKLATNRANAFAGTPIDITSNGSTTNANHIAQRQAMLGYFAPGVDARDETLFTWTPIAPVMWAMSVEAADYDSDGDLDVALSDRQNGASGLTIGNKGTTWFEFGGGTTWTRRTIYFSNNEGDPKFLEIVGSDTVMMGVSSDTNENRLYKSVTADNWATWTTTLIAPYPTDTGQYQGVTTCDLTGDAVSDYVLTHAVATGSLSGVVAYNGSTGARIDIDLAAGEKYDNALCLDYDGDGDLDVWTTEQNTGLAVVAFINPRLN